MADTITSQLEAEGLEAAQREYKRHQVEVAAAETLIGRLSNLVRHHPGFAVTTGFFTGLGLAALVRGLSCSRRD